MKTLAANMGIWTLWVLSWAHTHIPGSQWIPHVTRSDGLFETRILIHNTAGTDRLVILRPFREDGTTLPSFSLQVSAQEFRELSVSDLFGSTDVSHFSIDSIGGEGVVFSAAYRLKSGQGATAHVNQTGAGQDFALFPGEWDYVFDGMALVNTTDQQAYAEIFQIVTDPSGPAIVGYGDKILAPHSKTLMVFGDAFPQIPESNIRIVCSHPCSVVFLRGTYPQTTPGYLFQTVPDVPGVPHSNRLIPHHSPKGAHFKTTVYLNNLGNIDEWVTIYPRSSSGGVMTPQDLMVPASGFQVMSLDDVFPTQDVGYFEIVASGSLTTSVGYRISTGLGATAHVSEQSLASHEPSEPYRLYPGEWDRIFDGMAIVNTGNINAVITATTYDRQHNQTDSAVLISNLAPGEKFLFVFDSVFTSASNQLVEVTSSARSVAVFLRGTRPGIVPSYLYQTVPMPAPSD